jgi:hypothetical protein
MSVAWASRCLVFGCASAAQRNASCPRRKHTGCQKGKRWPSRELAADRLENYRALQRDVHRLRAKHDTLAKHEAHKTGRYFGENTVEAIRAG